LDGDADGFTATLVRRRIYGRVQYQGDRLPLDVLGFPSVAGVRKVVSEHCWVRRGNVRRPFFPADTRAIG